MKPKTVVGVVLKSMNGVVDSESAESCDKVCIRNLNQLLFLCSMCNVFLYTAFFWCSFVVALYNRLSLASTA